MNDVSSSSVIAAIKQGCAGDPAFVDNYLKYNAPRIVADAEFAKPYLRPNSSILDIGAVPPLMAGILRRQGFADVTIADPAASLYKSFLDTEGIQFADADLLRSLPNEFRGRFDFVCLNEVIEHLSGNLLSAVQNAINCVKGGGYFMLTTPNLRSLSGMVALLACSSGLASKPTESVRKQYERALTSNGYYGHVREYTPREIVELIESFGLRLVRKKFQSEYRRARWQRRVIGVCEDFIPPFRLFAKYLFRSA